MAKIPLAIFEKYYSIFKETVFGGASGLKLWEGDFYKPVNYEP